MCLSRLGIKVNFWHFFLFLLLGRIVKSELPSTPVFKISRNLFLLMKLAFMATITGPGTGSGTIFP